MDMGVTMLVAGPYFIGVSCEQRCSNGGLPTMNKFTEVCKRHINLEKFQLGIGLVMLAGGVIGGVFGYVCGLGAL